MPLPQIAEQLRLDIIAAVEKAMGQSKAENLPIIPSIKMIGDVIMNGLTAHLEAVKDFVAGKGGPSGK